MADSDYKQQAQEETNAAWNKKRTAMINANLGNNTLLTNQKAGINAGYDKEALTANKNYDTQVNERNLGNKISKNNMMNTAIGWGTARSSIINSQLAEADMINSRLVNKVNSNRNDVLSNIATRRNSDLSGIDNTIASNEIQLNNTLAQGDASADAEANSLARILADRQFSKDMQTKTFDRDTENQVWSRGMQEKTFDRDTENQNWSRGMQEKTFNRDSSNQDRSYGLQERQFNSESSARAKTIQAQLDAAAWNQSPKNLDNQYKQAQIDALNKANGNNTLIPKLQDSLINGVTSGTTNIEDVIAGKNDIIQDFISAGMSSPEAVKQVNALIKSLTEK